MTQLDLFRDGRSVQLPNALRQALLNEDAEAAAIACRELADFDAAHRWLPHARTLIATLQAPAPANEEEGLAVMARLEAEWLPAAEAMWRQRRRKHAASYWFALCWCDPDRFQRLMDRDAVPDSAFRDGWERWQDQEFETDFSALWFPAWMLIHEPEIAKLTPVPEASNSPQTAFAVLRELTMGNSDELKLRKQLQGLHPGLLASYMKRR